MKLEIPFKERVKNIAIEESKNYQQVYVDNSYLIFSTTFSEKDYYILSAEKDNYLHLIGVNTNLKADVFFDKCSLGTLEEDDFDFEKPHQDIRTVKGSVRRKINCLPNIKYLFDSNDLVFDENFKKNKVVCALAASDGEVTLGFTHGKKSRPKTLLKGNELKNPVKVDLIFSKKKSEDKFTKLVYGEISTFKSNVDKLINLVSDDLKKQIQDK